MLHYSVGVVLPNMILRKHAGFMSRSPILTAPPDYSVRDPRYHQIKDIWAFMEVYLGGVWVPLSVSIFTSFPLCTVTQRAWVPGVAWEFQLRVPGYSQDIRIPMLNTP